SPAKARSRRGRSKSLDLSRLCRRRRSTSTGLSARSRGRHDDALVAGANHVLLLHHRGGAGVAGGKLTFADALLHRGGGAGSGWIRGVARAPSTVTHKTVRYHSSVARKPDSKSTIG